MEEEEEYSKYFQLKFIKNKEIEDLEENSIIKEYDVSKKEFLNKLKKEGFKRKLTDSQTRNVLKMIKFDSAADFSVPGAGKTTEALAFFAFKKDFMCYMLNYCVEFVRLMNMCQFCVIGHSGQKLRNASCWGTTCPQGYTKSFPPECRLTARALPPRHATTVPHGARAPCLSRCCDVR